MHNEQAAIAGSEVRDRITRFSDQSVEEDHYVQDIFSGLIPAITALTGCDAVAFLDLSPINRAPIVMAGDNRFSPRFLESVADTLRRRLYELTGQRFSPADSPLIDGLTGERAGPGDEPASLYVEPVQAEDRIFGLLALAYVDPRELSHSIRQHLGQQAGVLARAAHHLDAVRGKAWRDWLTGVFNRRGMQAELYRCWMDSRRHGLPMCLLLADVDHFKHLNDTMGHHVGDMLLKGLVRFIQSLIRASDVVARFGGDELLLILPHTDAREGLTVAERLREQVAGRLFCPESGGGVRVTVSIGLAVLAAGDLNRTVDDLIVRADRSLFEAKRQGRNRVCLHLEEDDIAAKPAADSSDPPPDQSRITGTVLLVDDDDDIVRLMTRMLDGHGWRVHNRQNAEDAIAMIKTADPPPDVMVVDINLPGKSGLELLDEVRLVNENVVTIVITGDSTMENALHALRRGAYDFLGKPISLQAFINGVERAMEVRRLRIENARYQHHLEAMVEEKSKALRETLRQVEEAHNFTLESLSHLLDLREQSSGEHSTYAREVTIELARLMGFSEWEVVEFGRGALLHDIGKVAIPDSILLKPGALDDGEREIMETHCEVGYRMLAGCAYLQQVAEIVYQHQEHYDGTGYPRGLKGDEICVGARLFAVVDAYDAMRSHRVYRQALSREEACRRLAAGAGSQFDPEVVAVFLANVGTLEQVGDWNERRARNFASPAPEDILRHVRSRAAAGGRQSESGCLRQSVNSGAGGRGE